MEQVYEAIEIANKTGSIKKGINEATKAVERGKAKLVAYAADVNPKEIIMHLPLICKEKSIPCFEVPNKEELGAASGLPRSTGAVAITKEGDAKSIIKALSAEVKAEAAKEEAKKVEEVAPKEEAKPEPVKEEVKETPKTETKVSEPSPEAKKEEVKTEVKEEKKEEVAKETPKEEKKAEEKKEAE